MQPNNALPVADLRPRPVTMDEYMQLTPEKLELWSGYLIDEPEAPESRRALLALLMVNLGLVEVVKLAPRQRWLDALAKTDHPRAG